MDMAIPLFLCFEFTPLTTHTGINDGPTTRTEHGAPQLSARENKSAAIRVIRVAAGESARYGVMFADYSLEVIVSGLPGRGLVGKGLLFFARDGFDTGNVCCHAGDAGAH